MRKSVNKLLGVSQSGPSVRVLRVSAHVIVKLCKAINMSCRRRGEVGPIDVVVHD